MRTDASVRDEADLRLGKLAYQMGDMTEAGRRFGSLIGSPDRGARGVLLSIVHRRTRRPHRSRARGLFQARRSGRRPHRARPRRAAAACRRTIAPARSACSTSTPPRNAPKRSTWNSPRPRCSTTPAQSPKPSRCCSWRSSAFPIIRACATRSRSSRTRRACSAIRCSSFESLLKDRPEDASLLNALGYSLADRNQKLPRAEALIRKALEASPDNPAFLDSLGWVLFRRGDIPGALPHLERAYRIFPDAEIASHWGEAAVGERQAGRGARAVGAVAGARAGFQAAARHHRTADRHEDGTAEPRRRRRTPRRPEAKTRRRPSRSPPRPPRVVSHARAPRRASACRLRRAACCWPAAAPRRRRPRSSGPGADAPWPEQRAALEKLDRYGLNGRVAVAAQRAGLLRQPALPAAAAALESRARRAARHRRLARRASKARTSRSRPAAASSSMATRRAPNSSGGSASSCRSRELRWWLLGIPAPGEAARQSGCRQRRDPRLHAERLAREHQCARAPASGFALPQRLTAEREGARLQAAGAKHWQAVSDRRKSAWSAPAKLNLMLHIVGRRADGYHELQTVFQLIDLCDRIEIEVREDGVDHPAAGPGRASRKPRI